MASSGGKFAEAAQQWNLGQLYQDLGVAKGKKLTRTEMEYLRGLLCSYSPGEIADVCKVEPATVSTALSRGLYRYIENLLESRLRQQLSKASQVKNWNWVPQLLARAGYCLQQGATEQPKVSVPFAMKLDGIPDANESWDSKPDISVFYDRNDEIALLKQWALTERCRSIVLYGLGGIGKTSLAAKLTLEIKDEFECLIWRSLRNQPPVQVFLTDIFEFLNCLPADQCLQTTSDKISKLISYFQQHRCLLVLDDVQAVLSSGELSGHYQPGFEGYGELLRRLEEETHQSCVVLTSWENFRRASRVSNSTSARSYRVEGLGEAAKSILANEKLLDENLWDELISAYRGNPLALRVIAVSIQELFGGSVTEFLEQNTFFLGDLEYSLHQQFERLSSIEKEVTTCLALAEHALKVSEILEGITSQISTSELLKILTSLERRSLLEKTRSNNVTKFTLQPTVTKYAKKYGQ
ncbi:MAG: NB-ARC domain-containing protein [Cyanobacteria bacterium P01_B01_bin.77]